jgi:CxxC motif-containing protein (DUF1111 family)
MNATGNTRFFAPLPALLLAALSGCGGGGSGSSGGSATVEPAYARVTASGGDTTNFDSNQSSSGFDTPATNLSGTRLDEHLVGDAGFEVKFIKAVSIDFPDNDGVGPVFNNDACIECHTRDGRGNYSSTALNAPPGDWTLLGSNEAIFLRVSIGPEEGACVPDALNAYCAPEAVPGFSGQLFHRGVLGLRSDGSDFSGQADVYVKFETSEVTYGDGSTQTLYKPVFEIRNPYDSSGEAPGDNKPPVSRLLQDDVMTSPRMGLPVFGLGLLEAIPEADILALADPDDGDGDGISGKPNYVFDQVKFMQGDPDPVSLGRFGWKAGTPSVAAQGSGAYRGDMGVTNYLFPGESIVGTPLHDAYLVTNPNDDGQMGAEVNEEVVKAVMFYVNTLAVPARRNVDEDTVLRGATLFEQANCVACHHPSFTTGSHPGIWGPSGTVSIPEVEAQTIYPFTDMLLHDMGDGLADNRPDFLATGREWKTRPLWGVGLTPTVNLLAGYLHDGRARSLEEAILWHGGEAEAAREAFRSLSAADRDALVAFLRSL